MVDKDAAVYDVHGLRIRTTLALGAPVAAGDDFDVDLSLGPSAPVPAVPPRGGRVMAANRSGGAVRYVAVADGGATRVPATPSPEVRVLTQAAADGG